MKLNETQKVDTNLYELNITVDAASTRMQLPSSTPAANMQQTALSRQFPHRLRRILLLPTTAATRQVPRKRPATWAKPDRSTAHLHLLLTPRSTLLRHSRPHRLLPRLPLRHRSRQHRSVRQASMTLLPSTSCSQ